MSDTVREPQQQRSINTKNRIIEAGYLLFAENGYFNSTTAEIAKKAGVSTGIVYGYFRDKRDILLEVLDIYIDNIFSPLFEQLEKMSAPLNFESYVPNIVDEVVAIHSRHNNIHETLYSLCPTDKTVNDRFMEIESEITKKFAAKLTELGYEREDVAERVHVAMDIVQSYAHECVFDRHKYIDYAKMRDIVIKLLIGIFTD